MQSIGITKVLNYRVNLGRRIFMAKNRSLKYQFLRAIDNNFREGMDKHSDKRNGIRNTGRVYSYSDRKN